MKVLCVSVNERKNLLVCAWLSVASVFVCRGVRVRACIVCLCVVDRHDDFLQRGNDSSTVFISVTTILCFLRLTSYKVVRMVGRWVAGALQERVLFGTSKMVCRDMWSVKLDVRDLGVRRRGREERGHHSSGMDIHFCCLDYLAPSSAYFVVDESLLLHHTLFGRGLGNCVCISIFFWIKLIGFST